MLFNSIDFLIFLPLVFVLYWFVFNKSVQSQNWLLLVSSYVFYAWWDWKLLFLLIFSTLLIFFAGLKISNSDSQTTKRWWLWFSVIISIGLLCFFKYYNFFVDSWVEAWGLLGVKMRSWTINLILPVGISFYTFHGLSYVIDIYNQRIQPTKKVVDYSLFVSYFPLLVAGPIERATHLLPQLEAKRKFNYEQAAGGLRLIVWGLFKKIVIADTLAVPVNEIFKNYSDHTGVTLLLGAVFFAIQIYADFSGYTDIARGVSRLFGIELLLNFNYPYFSKSIPEFWHRWHISLSSWLNDYVYTPLALKYRNLKKWGIYLAIFLTFLISGFWHGAGWHFIMWGALHGIFYFPTVILSNKRFKSLAGSKAINQSIRLIDIPAILLTFSLVAFALIFFRSADIESSLLYVKKLFIDIILHPGQIFLIPKFAEFSLYVLVLLAIDLIMFSPSLTVRFKEKYYLKNAIDIAFIFIIISFLFRVDSGSFIYFQF